MPDAGIDLGADAGPDQSGNIFASAAGPVSASPGPIIVRTAAGWSPLYQVLLPSTLESCTLTIISQATGLTAFGPVAGSALADAGGYHRLAWGPTGQLPLGDYNYLFAASVNASSRQDTGVLRISTGTLSLIVDVAGSGAAETLPQGSVQPIIFTFTPADGTSALSLAGTPRFRLAAAASPAVALVGPSPVSTSFGSGTASVQATYLLDTTALPPGVYVALCAAGIAGPDGMSRVIEAQAVIQIVPGF